MFSFGEKIKEYDFKVINEREARASAGIMFLLGVLSLFSFIISKNLFYAEVFTVTFILEFIIRVFINPLYAPYMMLGSIFVSNQKPEWVEASPKRFAWGLGLILGVIMGYFIIFNILTPARLIVCLLCLALLFTESAFGICLGCILYNRLNLKLQKCPGGVCDTNWQKPKRFNKLLSLFIVSLLFVGTYFSLKATKYSPQKEIKSKQLIIKNDNHSLKTEKINNSSNSLDDNCKAPQWAIDMGHEQIWKEHHGCKE